MAKKKKRQSLLHSVFYRVYFAALLVFCIALILGINYLWKVMQDYEATRPIYAAQTAAAMFETGDYASLEKIDTSAAGLTPHEAEQYPEYMRSYASGKAITWQESFSGKEQEKKYTVKLDGQKFANFTLVPTGETSPHGFAMWTLGQVTTLALTPAQYTLTAPSDYAVTVNGAALPETAVAETGIPTLSQGKLPQGVESPTTTRYAFSLCFGAPEIAVTDPAGTAISVTDDGAGNYACQRLSDDSLKAAFEENVVAVAKKLANYTSEDLSQEAMLKYAAKDSPARETIKIFNNEWCPAHTGYDFENMRTYDYFAYGDSCFSCSVSFSYVIHYEKNPDNSYETLYTLYFVQSQNGYALYNFTMN